MQRDYKRDRNDVLNKRRGEIYGSGSVNSSPDGDCDYRADLGGWEIGGFMKGYLDMGEKRLTRNGATQVIAGYFKDIKRIAWEKQLIFDRYRGATAEQPMGHGATDNRTGDPERRCLEYERLTTISAPALRINAVEEAFSRLRHKLYPDKMMRQLCENDMEQLIRAIVFYCQHRREYPFHLLKQRFDIKYERRQFQNHKKFIANTVAELLML